MQLDLVLVYSYKFNLDATIINSFFFVGLATIVCMVDAYKVIDNPIAEASTLFNDISIAIEASLHNLWAEVSSLIL